MIDDSQIGPRVPLSDERIMQIIREAEEEAALSDDARRAERMAGLRCSCCDDPLPAEWTGDECASCVEINN